MAEIQLEEDEIEEKPEIPLYVMVTLSLFRELDF